ncbi:hypothetical protein GOFOIKOB_4531 [Methylobacterium tardum]|uniref:Uncharacterized protein n=1 Tax=Methylobacterium tardum TaxID=374432 RepID=A0AA37WTU9_9HYPH|nr:hypothetical protein [Methylobacterium tardum]GJE51472.1 hypothetical protein GOFOIKOB_4531 [Methylobacterium tardum]GLS73630.1 hypothetical protein GCM10007890_56450 [Methylobacterium tardum]
MSTADAIILLSSGVLFLAVLAVGIVAGLEHRKPPIKGRLEEIVTAAAKRKGTCL